MQLKLRTDYALRVLLLLAHAAARGASAPVQTEALADAFGISKDHVVKVVQDLARLGWIQTRAGRGGGIALAVDPAALTVADVVAAFEDRAGVLECVERPAVCVLEPGCSLRRLLIDAEDAFYATLATRTIAELAGARATRAGLTRLAPGPR